MEIKKLNLILDETDLKEKRNIERALIKVEKFIDEKLSSYFEKELKTKIIELISSDYNNLLENVKNQDIKGIKESLIEIKRKLNKHDSEKNNGILNYYLEIDFPENEDQLILSLFSNSYKLPKILKSEIEKINY